MAFDVKQSLKKFNIRPSKSLGQNFLADDSIMDRIVEAARLKKSDLVIEVGPGLGIMTASLSRSAGFVAAVELDKRLLPALNENLKGISNVSVINKDILKVNVKSEIIESNELKSAGFLPESVKVVANLPYYITTPVIMHLLEHEIGAELMVFMVQKEVAERITAKPGGKEYGALSVAVQFYSSAEKIADVPPWAFIPAPEVESSVVRLEIYKKPPVDIMSKEIFFKTVKAAFGQRRKNLVNALTNSGFFGSDKEAVKAVLADLGINENQRGETLSLEQFAALSNSLFSLKREKIE